nr:MAG TPA: hypothetical protein [Caudoviricetes sp.]
MLSSTSGQRHMRTRGESLCAMWFPAWNCTTSWNE